jgi:hypothetical protein
MRWSYKTIHYELKKEGILGSSFLDESEVELSLNQYGKAGWELVSLLETMDGLIAVFKQPLDLGTQSYSSSSNLSQRIDRSPKEAEKKKGVLKSNIYKKNDVEEQDENVAEAVLLDEFEVVEDEVEEDVVSTPSKQPVDIGLIRIE